MPKKVSPPPTGIHGNADLPSVTVESYNLELRDAEGFVGDRASKGAFLALVEEVREQLKEVDDDPLGETPTEEIGRSGSTSCSPPASPRWPGSSRAPPRSSQNGWRA